MVDADLESIVAKRLADAYHRSLCGGTKSSIAKHVPTGATSDHSLQHGRTALLTQRD